MLESCRAAAAALLETVKSGSDEARCRFKWDHPRFRGRPFSEVDPAGLALADAQLVIAREHAFETWEDLVEFTGLVERDATIARFETAVEAVIAGDRQRLQGMLADHPELARARSIRRHHATLLHYLGANGVEGGRQRTPGNAVEIAKLLLESGAEADAPADLYGGQSTTMSMLVSSSHPAEAGLQCELARTLLDYGAALEGPQAGGQPPLMTALTFGYLDTAKLLVQRGARVDTLPAAAGLGRLEEVRRLLPDAGEASRHLALALAAQHGQVEVLRLLLDAGEDPSRYNPEGHHSHCTPLHQAIWSNQMQAVELLVARGARLDLQDSIYQGTPLDWALYGERAEIAGFLRRHGAPSS
jgi:ankyrin repeat protein